MAYSERSGDIISLDNEKAGALTLSKDLYSYTDGYCDPITLWKNSYAVRTVTYYIARKVASIPFHLYDRVSDDDRRRITGTPLANALLEPVPGRGWSRFVEQLVLDMCIQDRWACLIGVGDDGRPTFHRIPAERVAVMTWNGVPQAVSVFSDAEPFTMVEPPRFDVPLDRVVFDVGPSAVVTQFDRGDSRLRTLSSILAEVEESSRWRRDVALNGPRFPAVIERPIDAPKWNDESWNRFRRQFSNYGPGGGKEGGTPVLEDGMTLKSVEWLKPDDGSSTIQVRALMLSEAAMLYGIPPELIGVRPGNYSNLQALRELEYVDVLGSWVTNLESAFNVGLRRCGVLTGDLYVEAAVESRLRGAFEDQASVLSTSVGAPWLTRNEARARQNLPAIEGGDELVTPLNVTIGGQASPQDGVTAGRGGGGELPAEPATEPETTPQASRVPLGAKAARNITGAGWPEINAQCDALERELSKFWTQQLGRIERSQDAIRSQGGLKSEHRKSLALTEWILQQKALERLLAARSSEIAKAGAEQILLRWNPDREGFDPDQMTGFISWTTSERAKLWSQDVIDRVNAAVDDDTAWADLLSSGELPGWVSNKSHRWGIETTEFGRHDAAKQSGLAVKTWRVTSPNPRLSHSRLGGVSVPIDDEFPNGCRYPGDWGGGPDEVAGCTCTVEYGKT